MIPTSGIYPLSFSEVRPFRVTSNRKIGFSASLEQALWSVDADMHRLGQSFVFISYQHPSGVPGLDNDYPEATDFGNRLTSSYRIYEVSSSGVNFSNTNVNTTDIINDLRASLSGSSGGFVVDGLLTTHSFDASDDVLKDWIKAVSPDGGGSTDRINRTWTHPYYTKYGSPPFPYLGYSGQLFDIDFDEVFYHPVPRLTFTTSDVVASSGSPGLSFGIYPIDPIFPTFAKLDGGLVSLSPYDSQVITSTLFDLSHVASGLIRINGDVLLPSGVYNFGGNLCSFVASGLRTNSIFGGSYQPMINRCYVEHPTGLSYPTAISKQVVVSNPIVWPPSGERVSALPSTDDYELIFYRPPGFPDDMPFGVGPYAPSGFEYFNDCIGVPTGYVPNFDGPYYGIQFLSPISSYPVWNRFGSGVNLGEIANYSPDQIVNDECAVRINNSTIIALQDGVSLSLSNFAFKFGEYNNNLQIQDHYFGEGAGLFATNGVGRIWNDGTDIYAIKSDFDNASDRTNGARISPPSTGLSGIINKWTYPTFGTGTQYRSNLADSSVFRYSCVGFHDGSDNYIAVSRGPVGNDLNACSGFSQLTLINGSNGITDNLFNYGPFEPIISSDINGPIVPIAAARITGASNFNDGIWIIFRVANSNYSEINGAVYLGRIAKISNEWVIQEYYAKKKFPLSFANSVPNAGVTALGSAMNFLLRMEL